VPFEARFLVKGLPGHPLHPPLTDATIGAYTLATVAAIASRAGLAPHGFAHVWWLGLIVALITTVLTATTGFIDWLGISWGTPLWKTATLHLTAMVTATVLFGIAAIVGHSAYAADRVNGSGLALTIVGFVVLTTGGWLGGAVVYVHGMRVLSLVDEPAERAVAPVPHEEKLEAEA
jgi:uncharacterized membrane protein